MSKFGEKSFKTLLTKSKLGVTIEKRTKGQVIETKNGESLEDLLKENSPEKIKAILNDKNTMSEILKFGYALIVKEAQKQLDMKMRKREHSIPNESSVREVLKYLGNLDAFEREFGISFANLIRDSINGNGYPYDLLTYVVLVVIQVASQMEKEWSQENKKIKNLNFGPEIVRLGLKLSNAKDHNTVKQIGGSALGIIIYSEAIRIDGGSGGAVPQLHKDNPTTFI